MIKFALNHFFSIILVSRRKQVCLLIGYTLSCTIFLYKGTELNITEFGNFVVIILINILITISSSIILINQSISSNNPRNHCENALDENINVSIGLILIHFIQIPYIILKSYYNIQPDYIIEISYPYFLYLFGFLLFYFNIIDKNIFSILTKKDSRGPVILDLLDGDSYCYRDYKIQSNSNEFYKLRINNEYRNAYYLRNNEKINLVYFKQPLLKEISIGIGYKTVKYLKDNRGRIQVKVNDKIAIDKNISSLNDGWNDYSICLNNKKLKEISVKVNNNNKTYFNVPYIKSDKKIKRNIIVLCLDGLRKDMLGLYSMDKTLSKNIDHFFKDYSVYNNAFAQGEWTLPVFASMMTSQYTSHHGLRNIDYSDRLPVETETLPEILQRNGYNTFGYFGAFRASPHFGFGRGFNKLIYKNNSFKLSHYDVNNNAIQFLKHSIHKNNFLFLHYMDVHPPYLNHTQSDNINTMNFNYNMMDLYNNKIGKNTNKAKFIRLMAENKIRELDFQLRRLFSDLKLLDMLNNTAFILMADHGINQPLDGTPNWREKLLTNERINVPFLIRCPWRKETYNKVIDDFIESSIDIFPTILDLAEVNSPHSTYSKSCIPISGSDFRGKKFVVTEFYFDGKYQCKIINSKYEYLRTFNRFSDSIVKEKIKDKRSKKYIKSSDNNYKIVANEFRKITRDLKLFTIDSNYS